LVADQEVHQRVPLAFELEVILEEEVEEAWQQHQEE
jgi:hypothetical protein